MADSMGSREAPSAGDGQSGGGIQVRKPKRNSETRKEQNRIASRNYREKRRRKLALLEQILDQANPDASVERAPAKTPHAEGVSEAVNPDIASSIITTQPPELPGVILTLGDPPFQGEWRSLFENSAGTNQDVVVGNASYSEPTQAEPVSFGFSSLPRSGTRSDPFSSSPPVPFEPPFDFATLLQTGLSQNQAPLSATMPSFDLIPTESVMNEVLPSSLVFNTASTLSPSSAEEILRSPPPKSRNLPTRLVKAFQCFANLSAAERRQVLSVVNDPGNFGAVDDVEADDSHGVSGMGSNEDHLQAFWERQRSRVNARLPDVKATIRVTQNGFFAAILQNALACGLAQNNQLLEDDGLSPYSRELVPATDSIKLAQVRLRFASVTKDLRPVDPQILISHHPYIDVIPFPTFRQRAMQAISCDPPLFDEEEMCVDMHMDGLICWGAQGNVKGMGACVPWDMRSWEPKVWFLRKYWFLVGGWDDEMWSNARWWHGLRGEKLDTSALT